MKSKSKEYWIILQHCAEHLQKTQYKHYQNLKQGTPCFSEATTGDLEIVSHQLSK